MCAGSAPFERRSNPFTHRSTALCSTCAARCVQQAIGANLFALTALQGLGLGAANSALDARIGAAVAAAALLGRTAIGALIIRRASLAAMVHAARHDRRLVRVVLHGRTFRLCPASAERCRQVVAASLRLNGCRSVKRALLGRDPVEGEALDPPLNQVFLELLAGIIGPFDRLADQMGAARWQHLDRADGDRGIVARAAHFGFG